MASITYPMKQILLIATGGTIASRKTAQGLIPMITSEEILSYIPDAASMCRITALQLFNIDSTNMNYTHWLEIASCIEEHYRDYDGFVVTHGTDTMAYTAAALSYLIQNSRKPIVLTGSQRSLDVKESDARMNLLNALQYACDDRASGIHIVFDGKVILGTRAKKTRTKSFNAFNSIDFPEVAVIRDRHLIYYIEETVPPNALVFYHTLNPRVFVLRLIPGMSADIFLFLKQHYDAVVVESFGVGGVPCYEDASFIDAIADWIASGKTLVMTTQVPHEGSDMEVYQVGHIIKEQYELMEAYDMTTEAIVAKLMWILGQTQDAKEIRKWFYEPVQKDIIS